MKQKKIEFNFFLIKKKEKNNRWFQNVFNSLSANDRQNILTQVFLFTTVLNLGTSQRRPQINVNRIKTESQSIISEMYFSEKMRPETSWSYEMPVSKDWMWFCMMKKNLDFNLFVVRVKKPKYYQTRTLI